MKSHTIILTIVFLSMLIQACQFQPSTPTPEPLVIAAPTDEPTPSPTVEPVIVDVSTATPTVIQHVTRPDTPNYIETQSVRDCSVGERYLAGEPVSIPTACDLWEVDFVERPTTSTFDVYYPYLDIESAQFGATIDWLFARIEPYEAALPADGSSLYYAFELDLDFDSISEILISVQNLQLSDVVWTVDGVRAWRFRDGEVDLFFDQGIASDPDLVWARRTPDGWVEFGFKPTTLDGDLIFAWWAWAYQGDLEASQFIPLDTMPDTLFAIDNTCAFGFNGDATKLPNYCR
ncbi:MAG: hypothetical protein AB1531_09150 [Chloroflexota bacterium]